MAAPPTGRASSSKLAAVLAAPGPPGPDQVNRRWGQVYAANVAASPPTVDVILNGVTVQGVRYLASYYPQVADVVVVDLLGGDPLVVGTMAPAPSAISALRCVVHQAVPQPIADKVRTRVAYDTPEDDPLGIYDPVTDLFTLPVAGRWAINAQMKFPAAAAGQGFIFLGDNAGTPNELREGDGGTLVGASLGINLVAPYRVTAGQQICVGVLQNSGAALSTGALNVAYLCWADIYYLGP